MISSSLIASISAVFMFLCLTKICKKQITAVFFALVYAFATCVWSVACRGIWQHGPSLLFITITLFLLLNENNALIPYAGFFLGMAVFNRPTNIIIALPLTVYIFNNYRGGVRIKYLILAMIPALLFSWYSYVYMGNVSSLGQGHELKLGGHFWRGLPGLLISPGRGLFVFSPIFIFSFAYLIYSLFSKNTRSIYRYLAISAILMVGAYAKWHGWWGGHCFGYRYLIELIPMLIIFLALCWEKVITTSRYLKITFFICLVVSIYFHFLGAFLYPAGFNYEPNNIDSHTERLWSVKDTELVRATKNLLKKFHVLHD